jgi:hypothetical protein
MYNGHYFGVLRVAVVDRFDCINYDNINHDYINNDKINFKNINHEKITRITLAMIA